MKLLLSLYGIINLIFLIHFTSKHLVKTIVMLFQLLLFILHYFLTVSPVEQ